MAPWFFGMRLLPSTVVSSARRRRFAAAALDFFRLLTMIVISGTSINGSTLFRG